MKAPPVPALEKDTQSAGMTHSKPTSRPSSGGPYDALLTLQHTVGNRAVGRLLRSGVIQAKLKIGQPNDRYEQEADRVAEQVMRMREPCFPCQVAPEDSQGETLQTKPSARYLSPLVRRRPELEVERNGLQAEGPGTQIMKVAPGLETHINALTSQGQSLPIPVRDYFESRFG